MHANQFHCSKFTALEYVYFILMCQGHCLGLILPWLKNNRFTQKKNVHLKKYKLQGKFIFWQLDRNLGKIMEY